MSHFALRLTKILGFICLCYFPPACSAVGQRTSDLERPLCFGWLGWIEYELFDSWRELVASNGRPKKSATGVVFETIPDFFARDGTKLYGYRAFDELANSRLGPAILIVPGNAMLADQLYLAAAYFALHGMTSYVFDYRGYGGSSGTPYAKAIIDDYRVILSFLEKQEHTQVNVYALSFGGIISLAAIKNANFPDALVLDGVPSELPLYSFCPDQLDPVNNLAKAPKKTFVISGGADRVVPEDKTDALRRKADKIGMKAEVLEGFSHPGRDKVDLAERRLVIVNEFLK